MSEIATMPDAPATAPDPDETVAALLAERQSLVRANRMLAARVDALMNVHHAAILILDPETGDILDANDAAVRRYARSRTELLTRNIREINTLSQAEIAKRVRLAVSARRHHFEFGHRLADGTVQEVDVYSGPILYDGKVALISFIHDATRRKTLERKLKTIASTDSLTGACNRRRFLSSLHQEFRRARQARTPLAFAMLALDPFKLINDTHGHAVGDAVLKGFAAACRRRMRECDCFGRLGGEEFGILMPATALGDAGRALERLIDATRRHAASAVGATVSIGLTAISEGDDTENPLLRRADAALYLAKANGRDRIEILP